MVDLRSHGINGDCTQERLETERDRQEKLISDLRTALKVSCG